MNPSNSSHFVAQMKRSYEAFKRPSTMLEVSARTGIMRANICRYVSEWRKAGKIQLVKIDTCPISKHKAGFFTTDPKLFKTTQTKLF